MLNHAFRLASRPVGLPTRDVWDYIDEDLGEPAAGEVLVRVKYISLDPAMRGWMMDRRSYVPPIGIGEVMRAIAVGEVVASKFDGLEPGEHVSGLLGVQEYAL